MGERPHKACGPETEWLTGVLSSPSNRSHYSRPKPKPQPQLSAATTRPDIQTPAETRPEFGPSPKYWSVKIHPPSTVFQIQMGCGWEMKLGGSLEVGINAWLTIYWVLGTKLSHTLFIIMVKTELNCLNLNPSLPLRQVTWPLHTSVSSCIKWRKVSTSGGCFEA